MLNRFTSLEGFRLVLLTLQIGLFNARMLVSAPLSMGTGNCDVMSFAVINFIGGITVVQLLHIFCLAAATSV